MGSFTGHPSPSATATEDSDELPTPDVLAQESRRFADGLKTVPGDCREDEGTNYGVPDNTDVWLH